jgi:hypothetical protein
MIVPIASSQISCLVCLSMNRSRPKTPKLAPRLGTFPDRP